MAIIEKGNILGSFSVGATTSAGISKATILPTLDEVLADCGQLYSYITIAGLGFIDSTNTPRTYKLSSMVVPGLTTDETAQYKPILTDWPSQLTEKVNPLGGIGSAGEVDFSVADNTDGNLLGTDTTGLSNQFLTNFLRDDNFFVSFLVTAIDDTATTVETQNGAFKTNDVIYMQDECLHITSLAGSAGGIDTWNVTRAIFGTDARNHAVNSKMFDSNFFAFNRRIRMYYGAVQSGISTEREIGNSWIIDNMALTSDFNGYTIRGISQEVFADRLMIHSKDVMRKQPGESIAFANRVQLISFLIGNPLFLNTTSQVFGIGVLVLNKGIQLWRNYSEARYFFVPDSGADATDPVGEVLAFECVYSRNTGTRYVTGTSFANPRWVRRGLAGSKIADNSNFSDQSPVHVFEVMYADADLLDTRGNQCGSFRFTYDAGGAVSTNRLIGTWEVSDHPIVITLCVMLSSRDPTDGLELTNHDGFWNFSSLPWGIGIGIPIGDIDLDSFIRVWDRTRFMRSPHTVVGKVQLPFSEWFENEFGWTRIVIRQVNGLWKADILAAPLLLTPDLVSITDTEVLAENSAGDGVSRPAIFQARQFMDLLASKISYECKDARGRPVLINYSEDDFQNALGQSGYYQKKERIISFTCPGVRISSAQDAMMLNPLALSLLIRLYKPIWGCTIRIPIQYDSQISVGDLMQLTNALLPKNGARGWTNEDVVGYEKKTVVSGKGTYIEITIYNFGLPGRFGRISASGKIVSTANAGAGTVDIVIESDRYTDIRGGGSVPKTDAQAFKVGWDVKIYDSSGVELSPTEQSINIVDTGTQTINVDGDFGGVLPIGGGTYPAGPNGIILSFTDYDNAQVEQTNKYAAIGSDLGIGVGNAALWNYSEF